MLQRPGAPPQQQQPQRMPVVPTIGPRSPAPSVSSPVPVAPPIQTAGSPTTHRVVVSASGDPKTHGAPLIRKTVTLTASAPSNSHSQQPLHPQQTSTTNSKENLYIVALPQGHQLRQGQNIVAATIMNTASSRPEQ